MTIFAARSDLLGSALMNFAHAWGFADKLGQRLCVNWINPHPHRPSMPWAEIYQRDTRFDVIGIPPPPEAYAVPRVPHSSASLAVHRLILYPHTSWLQLDYEVKIDYDARVRALLLSVPVHPVVAFAVEAISARVPAFDAVHIRRGTDVLSLMGEGGDMDRAASIFVKRFADLETFRAAIAACGVGRMLVFSNNGQDARKIGEWVGDMPELAGLTSTQRDFAEMLLMSRARKIIGTRSNYSYFARLLGNCPLILVHKWLDPERVGKFVDETVPAHAIPAVKRAYAVVFSRLVR